jgi:photosystem II stability/assembly factor-like uncharacterized protein
MRTAPIDRPLRRPAHAAALALLLALAGPAAAQWQPMAGELIKREKPGFGGLCGVVVDHKTGTVFIDLSDKGLYRSTDQAKTWEAIGKPTPKGRTEWPGCLMFDPIGGKTLVAALVYGSPIAVSRDTGATWKFMDRKSSHVDWCAVDWSDPDMKFVLTLKHESGDLLLVSRDGGKSFEEVGKGYGPAWIFDAKTAVVAEARSKAKPKPGLLRTTDAGKTFVRCGDYSTKALPRWRDGKLYWVVDGALIASADKGETWKKLGDLKDGRCGPVFGKTAEHLFVLTGAGVVESGDGGKSWARPIAPPKELKGVSALTWLEYDPVHDSLYLMKMGSELYRLPSGAR